MFDTIFSIITMIAVLAAFSFYFFIKKKDGKDWVYAVYFLTILLTGTVLYSLGLAYKEDSDTSFSLLFVIAKGLASGLRAFTGDFNAAATSKLAQSNQIYEIAVFVNYFAAMFLTFLISIKLFGKNIVNRVRVFINSFCSKHIVVGASGQAEIFLQSFDYKKRKRITVVLEPKHSKMKSELMFMGFAVVVIKAQENNNKKKAIDGKKEITEEVYEALKTAGFMRNKKSTKIIAMSEDDEINLLVAKVVTDYIASSIKPTKEKNGRINKLEIEQENLLEKIKLAAHIMYEFLDRAEHFAFAEYALGRVKFFNPYEVRARKFMLENPITSLIPKQWINTSKARLFNKTDKGCDRSYKIGNVFVGYGFTNQYILKKSICDYQLLGTDYNAIIIDKDAKKLEKQFQNSAHGLFNESKDGRVVNFGSELQPNTNGEVYFPNPDEKYNINFIEQNVLSADFYKSIIEAINGKESKQGYDFVSIVVALGSDKLSIETALELRQKLYERRLLKAKCGEYEFDRVRIFVKIMQESVLSTNTLLNDKNDIECEITVFGASDEILNEDYVIHEKLDLLAKRIANDYWKIAGAESQKTNVVSKWDSLTEFKRNSNRYAAMSIRTKLNLLGFELEDGKGETSQKIIDLYKTLYNLSVSDAQRAVKAKGQFVDFAERDANGIIIDNARNNLARLEHQRWNTIHLLNGWTKLAKAEVSASIRQDEKAKQHACIATFEGLSELRKKQADDAIAIAKKKNEELSLDKALSDADTVCYDFDVMDRLFGSLKNSGFYVSKKNVGIITYNAPHLKTQQVLAGLIKNYPRDEYVLITLPFVKKAEREVVFQHRPMQLVGETPQELAKKYNIELLSFEKDSEIKDTADLYIICGAGILSAEFVTGRKIINCHPGIIPTVRGLDAFKWAIYNNLPMGNTLHYIDEKVDAGEVIAISVTSLQPSDTLEAFAQRHYESEIVLLTNYKSCKSSVKKYDAKSVNKRMTKAIEVELECRFVEYKRQNCLQGGK